MLKYTTSENNVIWRVSYLIGNLRWTNWIDIGSNIGISARYRKSGSIIEVYAQGSINNKGFTAGSGYQIGLLPENARPPYARRYQLTDTRLYMEIRTDGDVAIISTSDIQSTHNDIWFSETFGISQ